MKKLIVLLVMMCSLAPVLRAADGCNQRLSPAEFRARQKAYITEKAGLTKEEAARFFPLYFELQDKKKDLPLMLKFTLTVTILAVSMM